MPELYFNNPRHADLPLHHGHVPPWLADRMAKLGGAITEAIVLEYGKSEFLRKLSDPCWFQAFGCVLGMDWHSSGITTSVMGALKKALNPRVSELGIYICGGKGRYSKNTPAELLHYAQKTGLNGPELVRYSRLTAKVDNTAIQDGFQIYLHTFVITKEGEWVVVQQGLNDQSGMARRYHWHSEQISSFVTDPHTFIYGRNQGMILNLADAGAVPAQGAMLSLVGEDPGKMIPEIQRIVLPSEHALTAADVNVKRLGAMLTLAHEREITDFEDLLLLEGVGPRTIQSLALVSEVIHGTPARFTDPGRFSFAHGGKDGHPFPVPLTIYDETIQHLQNAVDKARIGDRDKMQAMHNLTLAVQGIENQFEPGPDLFDKAIQRERANSYRYGGRTVFGEVEKPKDDGQLSLF